MDPLAGVRAAVLRAGDGRDDPWYPAERLSLADALTAYTAGPALAAGMASSTGRIAEGHTGDLVVLRGDLEDVGTLGVSATIVAGEVVYQSTL